MIRFLISNKCYRQTKVNSTARSNLDVVKMRVYRGSHKGAEMLCSVTAWPHSLNLSTDAAGRQSKLLTDFTQAGALEHSSPPSFGPALFGSSTAFPARSLCVPTTTKLILSALCKGSSQQCWETSSVQGEGDTEATANFRWKEKKRCGIKKGSRI